MTNDEFKATLWEAANKLRGSVSAARYKCSLLGVTLPYVDGKSFECFLGKFAVKGGKRAA